ncbi:TPA: hypothetical protein ACRZK8_005376 [Escherichia coli]|uniref:hypothetical protein n=1 Tax=Escherichia coli TaxID=562 RepID=UPI000DA4A37C|nr:hypothetical protein [Escherichia coli]EFB2395043.1 hypothetical protein [Escherichia coli]EHK0927294.1 hypothetical protein [Escherichia coli]QMM11613.1 hypothetical protein HVX20_14530 [Escherichia coli]QMM17208.1 hypothetical protein HVX19_14530 [Escherichia coli]QMM27761.1 hypothetical protein HVX17_14530 [Escherichia coli]
MIHHTIVVTGESCGAARYRNVSKLTISKHSIFGISYNFNDAVLIQHAILQITQKKPPAKAVVKSVSAEEYYYNTSEVSGASRNT